MKAWATKTRQTHTIAGDAASKELKPDCDNARRNARFTEHRAKNGRKNNTRTQYIVSLTRLVTKLRMPHNETHTHRESHGNATNDGHEKEKNVFWKSAQKYESSLIFKWRDCRIPIKCARQVATRYNNTNSCLKSKGWEGGWKSIEKKRLWCTFSLSRSRFIPFLSLSFRLYTISFFHWMNDPGTQQRQWAKRATLHRNKVSCLEWVLGLKTLKATWIARRRHRERARKNKLKKTKQMHL